MSKRARMIDLAEELFAPEDGVHDSEQREPERDRKVDRTITNRGPATRREQPPKACGLRTVGGGPRQAVAHYPTWDSVRRERCHRVLQVSGPFPITELPLQIRHRIQPPAAEVACDRAPPFEWNYGDE